MIINPHNNYWTAEQRVGDVLCIAEGDSMQQAIDGCAALVWGRTAQEMETKARARFRKMKITEAVFENGKQLGAAMCEKLAKEGRAVWAYNPYDLGTPEYFGWARVAEAHYDTVASEKIKEAV